MTPRLVIQILKTLVLLTAAIFSVGCGGSGSVDAGSNSGYHFNTSNLNCPSDSLDITKAAPPFPNNSDVTFKNRTTGQSYDAGGGVATANGLDNGMPTGAPAGSYDVFVTPPGGT